MQVYNTFTQKKEEFKPVKKNHVGMYVCGPTVYDLGHLGHGRSAVSFDVIRKYFIFKGYTTTFVTNYTDIDDKMITRAELMKITVPELAAKIIPEYAQDYASLGVMAGDVQPKATENIPEMIEIIAQLEQKGHTYVIKGDGVYFDITTFKNYGKLSKQKLDELKSGIRVAVKELKRNPQDFVLWKFSKPGEPLWDSPWGEGRPGWHIECSAMSSKYLGETFDIHGGGADLTFPHHECEIAQSESYSGKTFCKYWLHNGFIQVNNEKMSKSLGNFFTLRDVFKKFDPQVVRYLFLQTHYRSPIEFSDALLEQSKNSLERVHNFHQRLMEYQPAEESGDISTMAGLLDMTQKDFVEAMDNDFETPVALAACFDLVKEVNKFMDQKTLTRLDKEQLVTFLERIDSVLGIFVPTTTAAVDMDVEKLIQERDAARDSKDWKRADEIRDELLAKGIKLEDSAGGTKWKKV
jgi:cysteinyl-tRNA synthetase